MEPRSKHLNHLRKLAENGDPEVPISKKYDFGNIHDTLTNELTLQTQGKMVLDFNIRIYVNEPATVEKISYNILVAASEVCIINVK